MKRRKFLKLSFGSVVAGFLVPFAGFVKAKPLPTKVEDALFLSSHPHTLIVPPSLEAEAASLFTEYTPGLDMLNVDNYWTDETMWFLNDKRSFWKGKVQT